MGRVQHGSRTKGSAKSQLKSFKTKRYARDLDQIAYDLSLAHAVRSLPNPSVAGASGARVKVDQVFGGKAYGTVTNEVDEDTPGMGDFPCVECARFFADALSLQGHLKSKVHKRRSVPSRCQSTCSTVAYACLVCRQGEGPQARAVYASRSRRGCGARDRQPPTCTTCPARVRTTAQRRSWRSGLAGGRGDGRAAGASASVIALGDLEECMILAGLEGSWLSADVWDLHLQQYVL